MLLFDLSYYFFNGLLNFKHISKLSKKSRQYILYRFLFESVIPISVMIPYVWCILWYEYDYKFRMHNTGCWKQNGIIIIKCTDLYGCNTSVEVECFEIKSNSL